MNNLFDSRLLQMYRLTVKLIVLDYVGNAGHRQKVTRESGGQSGCGRSQIFNPITVRTHTPAPAHTQTHTAARRPAVVFSQRDEMGGRWGLGEGRVVSERSKPVREGK